MDPLVTHGINNQYGRAGNTRKMALMEKPLPPRWLEAMSSLDIGVIGTDTLLTSGEERVCANVHNFNVTLGSATTTKPSHMVTRQDA